MKRMIWLIAFKCLMSVCVVASSENPAEEIVVSFDKNELQAGDTITATYAQ